MKKTYDTIQQYHTSDADIKVHNLNADHFRVALLTEQSSEIRFTSTDRNCLCVDLSGTVEHFSRIDGVADASPTNPSDVCLIPPGVDVEFSWVVRGNSQTSIALEFDSSIFQHYAAELDLDRLAAGHLLAANFAPRPGLEAIARLLAREVRSAMPHGRIYQDSVMRLLALEVASHAWTIPQELRPYGFRFDRRIGRAIDYVDAHFKQDISLLDISRASGLSPTHLTSLFKRLTGKTPYSYVIDRRLEHASSLLLGTQMPIAQIAYEAGFSDQQHMTRAFRARLGHTPNSLRRA